MPYARRYRRRTYRRKYSGFRRRGTYRRRVVKKAFRKMSRVSGMSVKLRVQVPVLTDTNGNFSMGVNANGQISTQGFAGTTNFITATNSAGTLVEYPLIDANLYEPLYEQVRCSYIKYRFIPRLPNNNSATTVFTPFFHSWDRDGHRDIDSVGLTSLTVADILDETRTWEKNLYMPFRWRQRTVSYKMLSKFPTIASTNSNTTYPAGYWHYTEKSGNEWSHLISIIRDASPSTNYGTMVFTAYIILKDRR